MKDIVGFLLIHGAVMGALVSGMLLGWGFAAESWTYVCAGVGVALAAVVGAFVVLSVEGRR